MAEQFEYAEFSIDEFLVRQNHWLPRSLGLRYLTLGRTLYCSTQESRIPAHEFLHLVQFRKYGTLRVLCHYLIYGLRNVLVYRSLRRAFSAIPFEVEARQFAAEWGPFYSLLYSQQEQAL